MTFKRNLIALSIAAFTLSLTACDLPDLGGDDNDETEQNSEPANTTEPVTENPIINPINQTAKQSVSGATADGYLVNAKVCLDLNANARCDENEPMAYSEQAGAFSIENISSFIDLSKFAIIVEVIAGQTMDEDNPGVILEKGYRLTAPEGVTDFISPITTLVSATLEENNDLSVEEAREVVKDKLGLSGTDIDVMKDYVAAKEEQETGDDYHRIHKVAQVLAGVMAEADEEIINNAEGIGAENDEVRRVLQKIINNKLDEVVELVDKNTDENFNAKEAVLNFIEKDHLSLEEIEAQIKQDRIEANSEPVSFVGILSNGGIYSLEGDQKLKIDESTNSCMAIRDLAYQHITLDDDNLINFAHYSYSTAGFNLTEDNEPRRNLVWLGGSWQSPNQLMTLVSENDNGSVLIDSQSDGRMMVWSEQIDLSGKPLNNFMNTEREWQGLFDDSQVFSEGAIGYLLKFEQVNDVYYLPESEGCETTNDGQYTSGFCNLVFTQNSAGINEAATDFQQLLSSESNTTESQNWIQITHHHHEQIMMSLTGDLQTGQGEANFYLHSPEKCEQDFCDERKSVFIGASSWSLTEQGLEYNLPAKAQSWLDDKQVSPLFTLHQGQVRRAYRVSSGNTERGDWSLNGSALTTVINAIEPNNLMAGVDNYQCGIYEDKKEGGDFGGQETEQHGGEFIEHTDKKDEDANHDENDGVMREEDKVSDPTDEVGAKDGVQ